MTDNPPSDAAQVVALAIALVRQATTLAAHLTAASGLPATDVTGMRALDELSRGELRAGVLAQRLRLSSAATTGLLDRLERAELATRRTDPADRRRILVALTPRARAFGSGRLEPFRARIVAATATVPPSHLGSVKQFLAHVVGDQAD